MVIHVSAGKNKSKKKAYRNVERKQKNNNKKQKQTPVQTTATKAAPDLEEFNSFQYWKVPIQDVATGLSVQESCCKKPVKALVEVKTTEKDVPKVKEGFSSFMYWREPVPELSEDEISSLLSQMSAK